MKKLKAILALMIAMAIMCISMSTTFAATDAEKELYKKMYDLLELCEEAHFAFGIGYSITESVEPGYPNRPKYLACSDTTELVKAWEDACPMVEGYFDSYMSPYDGEISIETATAKYDTLHEELYKIVIDRSELKLLVAFCEQESNDNNYYEAQLWDDFQSEIAQSKELLADESITDMRVNIAYYELMYQFNLLCITNRIAFDVDNDELITILDATCIQLILAGYRNINYSQLVVLDKVEKSGVNIIDVTFVQRYCAHYYSSSLESASLDSLANRIEMCNPESDEFELSSFRYNWVYYDGIREIYEV